jgi:hypothetical protein
MSALADLLQFQRSIDRVPCITVAEFRRLAEKRKWDEDWLAKQCWDELDNPRRIVRDILTKGTIPDSTVIPWAPLIKLYQLTESGCLYNEAYVTLDAQVLNPGEFNQVKYGRVKLPETQEEKIRALQEGLAVLGYNSGKVDGVLSHQTLAAMEKYKRDKGLSSTASVEDIRQLVSMDAALKLLEKMRDGTRSQLLRSRLYESEHTGMTRGCRRHPEGSPTERPAFTIPVVLHRLPHSQRHGSSEEA